MKWSKNRRKKKTKEALKKKASQTGRNMKDERNKERERRTFKQRKGEREKEKRMIE